MIIDCASCTVRGIACASCAVTFVAAEPAAIAAETAAGPGAGPVTGPTIELDAAEARALAALAGAGMIPPLRYAPPMAKAS